MNIALIGYGKMGKAIEQIAINKGHKIVAIITTANNDELAAGNLNNADVAIEFTNPESAPQNIVHCINAGVAVVCGTTGWNAHFQQINNLAIAQKVGLLCASNFSIGVNIFFEINKHLAALMNGRGEYNVAVTETHHIHKKDKPGGTAISIAEQIIANIDRKNNWVMAEEAVEPQALSIVAHRKDEVPGTHTVAYSSAIDDITITHTAHNRTGFATGAVLAAEYLQGKTGIFTMKDVLGL
jgi:4-hydroxy-tetrahydrodipicolinate reductase